MKLWVFVVTLLSLSLSIRGDVNKSLANLGVGLSTESMNQLLNTVLLPVFDLTIAGLGQELPQDCCYHNPSSNTRLYIKELAIPPSSVSSFGSLSSSSSGVLFDLFLKFDMTFYYHLCEEVGLGCTSLSLCNGNADLEVNVNLKFQLIFNAGPEGHLTVTFDSFDLHLGFPSKKGLCLLLSTLIDAATPILNAVLDKVVPVELGHLLDEINGVNQTKNIPYLPFAVSWSFTNDTGSSIDGLGLQMIVNILLESENYQAAPFLPSPALPPILTLMQQQQLFLDMSDSFLSNLIYALFSVHGLKLNVEADGWNIALDVTDSPIVYFVAPQSPDDAAELVIQSKAVATQKPLRFTIHSTATIHCEVIITPEGQLYLDLDPDEMEVVINSATPPLTNGTKNLIEKEIEDAWASEIPRIDEKLRNLAIQLPQIAGFNNPQIVYNQGYASFSLNTLPESGSPRGDFVTYLENMTQELTKNTFFRAWNGGKEVGNARNLGCPQINAVGFEEGC